jgi:hypothetical protein
MTTIEAISCSLSQLEQTLRDALAQVNHRERQLDARELEMVAAAEGLTVTARVRQAELLGRDLERQRVVGLIDAQLDELRRGGLNALSLEHLRKRVQEVEL